MSIVLGISRELGAPATAIWAVMGRFSRLPDWFPMLQSFDCTADTVAAVRRIGIAGVEVRQELLEQDDTGMRTVYRVFEGPGIDRDTDFVVTIIVTSLAADRCRVDWSARLAQLPSLYPAGADALFIQRTEANYVMAMDYFQQKIGA